MGLIKVKFWGIVYTFNACDGWQPIEQTINAVAGICIGPAVNKDRLIGLDIDGKLLTINKPLPHQSGTIHAEPQLNCSEPLKMLYND